LIKRVLIGFILLLAIYQTSVSQTLSVNNIVNNYLKVLEVQSGGVKVENDTAELSAFQPGDKVLLIQMTGATKGGFSRLNSGIFLDAKSCGKFEILQVDEVQTGGTDKYVTFTDNVNNSYDSGEKIQLVRITEGEKIIVSGTVTAKDWDGNTGGIVAMIGLDTIALQADIDVTSKGFRGGQPENNYPENLCRSGMGDTVNWLETETGRAGNKGEGIIEVGYIYKKGAANSLNGGGGGNGFFSGGGGGSNYRDGGKGGMQSNYCTPLILVRAEGGFNQTGANKFYDIISRQIMMGGGGGSGTQNSSLNHYATPGGDGGGIIMLITETLIGNGRTLLANGQNVTVTASASGGGGGGGGTILIDAAAYSGNFTVEAKGGNGGNTLTNCTGAGGAGSGGVLWYSGTTLPGSTVITSSGTIGQADPSCSASDYQYGLTAGSGAQLNSFLLPLNGFLFNAIHRNDTICAGQVPNQITGSNPKGGNGIYTYLWQQSTDSMSWDTTSGIYDSKHYQQPALYQTTFYRRIVSSVGIIDTSRAVKVFVYPDISNNSIAGTDTICSGSPAKQLTGTVPPPLSGGNGSFSYKWLHSPNGSTWDTVSGVTSPTYNSDTLPGTHYYKRYVKSTKYCNSTSNSITVTVLSSITYNSFYSEDTLICQTFSPGPLNAKRPAGGDGNYHYAWQKKLESGNWQAIASSDVMRYNPGLLNDTTEYRRIVYSGNDDACINTSSPKSINVLPSLANNQIYTDSVRYCAGDMPESIIGSGPTGGGGSGTYSYQWQIITTGNWNTIDGATGKDFTPMKVEHDTLFRRIVSSGLLITGQYACHDTSSFLSLEVIPSINNHLGLTDQTLCQHNIPLPFSPGLPTGGYGGFTYQWLTREEGSPTWDNAPGVSTSSAYVPGSLEDATYFTRLVKSDICEQISDTVTVTVYPVISNNSITGSPIQYACFNTSKPLNASTPEDGKTGDYSFLWQQSSNGLSWSFASGISQNTQLNFESSGLTDSILFRRVVFSSAALKECSDTSDPILIRINPLPAGDVVNSFDTVCNGETLFISFTVSGGHGPYKVTVGEGLFKESTDVTSSFDSIPLVFNSDHEIRMMIVEDDSSCLADLSGNGNKVAVKVYDVPDANAGLGGEICSNQFTLHAEQDIPSSTGLWTVPGGSFTDSISPSTMVTMDDYGIAVITWTETNWRCSDSDTVMITFDEQPVTIDAGIDTTLEFLYATRLNALPPKLGTGKWTVVEGSGILSNNTQPNAEISELSAKNLLRWTVKNGICPDIKDSMRIDVKFLEIQKGFTPNGDGINDEFIIPTPNAEKIAVKIYNRTGKLVFESDDYTEGDPWNGTGKNKIDLPEGTYFYVMDIWARGRIVPFNFRSFVEILR
jgi:gliding motility-associated-like protein